MTPADVRTLVERLRRTQICGWRGFVGETCCILENGHVGNHAYAVPREPTFNQDERNEAATALESLDQWKRAVIDCLNPLRKHDPVWSLGRDLNDPDVVVGQIEAMRDELAELRKDRDHLRTLVGIAHEAFNAAMKESNGG